MMEITAKSPGSVRSLFRRVTGSAPCPEEAGGFDAAPRPDRGRRRGAVLDGEAAVLTRDGIDVTRAFVLGLKRPGV
jgi:uncharacterized protein YbbK (DUF523 family)